MDPVLIGIISSVATAVFGLIVWMVKNLVPRWMRSNQDKTLKQMDEQSRNSLESLKKEDRILEKALSKDDALIQICQEVVKNIPVMIQGIKDAVVSTKSDLSNQMELSKFQLNEKLDAHTDKIIKAIEDRKFKELADRMSTHGPDSKLSVFP